MQTIKARLRKRGNNLWATIPLHIIREENLKENQEIEFMIIKKKPIEFL